MLETIQQPTTPILVKDLEMIYPTATSKQKARYGVYQCECGKEFRAQITNVKRGITKSCGCYNRKRVVETHTTHGLTDHKLFGVWKGMVKRTTNQNEKNFKHYGGRGIFVCDEWKNDFKKFYDDMVGTYQEGLSIDRIDNGKGYNPENCRWTTREVQVRNTRRIYSTNKSGYRGVSWYKKYRNWVAQIQVNGKKKNLGYFETALDAARAYDRFVIENNLEHTRNGVI